MRIEPKRVRSPTEAMSDYRAWETRRRKRDRIIWRARLKRRPRYIAKGGIKK